MPLELIRQDITKMDVDAIVNAANSSLLGGGGVDGAIHRAAGPKLLEESRTLHGCETGNAKITKGYDLPAKYVIHTVGPVWHGGTRNEKELLTSCYEKSLELAVEYGCGSVAFPLISAGVYGYPKREAVSVATDTITKFLSDHDLMVYLVLFDKSVMTISQELYSDIREFVDDNYVTTWEDSMPLAAARREFAGMEENLDLGEPNGKVCADESAGEPALANWLSQENGSAGEPELADWLSQVDESFSEMLLRKIDEKGLTDPQVYNRANVDRKLFSKIRSDIHYHPKKTTVLALAVALELDLADTRELLEKAGYALSHANRFDLIIEYFIRHKNYNVFEINEALFEFDQPLLGSR